MLTTTKMQKLYDLERQLANGNSEVTKEVHLEKILNTLISIEIMDEQEKIDKLNGIKRW